MRINSFNRPEMNPYNRQAKQAGQPPRKEQADQIEISNAAKELQQNSKIDAERKARIEHLKNQVQNGEYKADPKETAKGIAKFFFNQ